MECKFCRSEVPEGAKVCPVCGTLVENEADRTAENRDAAGNQYGAAGSQYGTTGDQYGFAGQGQGSAYQYGTPNQAGYYQPAKRISGTPYMVFAIITTLLCCMPLGIAAIVSAVKIDSLQKNGDYAGARKAAKNAKIFTIIGAITGLLASVFFIGISVYMMDNNTELSELYSGISEFDVKRAEVGKGLSNEWDSYTIQINDKFLAFPCTMESLQSAGFTLDTEDTPEDYILNAGDMVPVVFDGEGAGYIIAYVVNVSDEAKTVLECSVAGIYADNDGLGGSPVTVVFPGGIQIGMSEGELPGGYGDPDEVDEESGYKTYIWTEDEEYYSSVSIYVDQTDEKISAMEMMNWDD